MKILYIIHDNKKGGAALSFLEMVVRISKQHEIYVLTPHKNGFLPKQLDELDIKHGHAHYFWWMIACPSSRALKYAKLRFYYLMNGINRFEAWYLSRKLQKEKFDLIHSNSSVINFGGLLSKYMHIPHVWHIREYGKEDFDLFPVYSYKKICEFMNQNSDRIIAISKAIETKYRTLVDPKKIIQIYNGIADVMNYQKKKFPQKGDNIVFLIAGNYFREKGQIDVAKAVRILLQVVNSNFEVWMAGNGDFAEIKEYIKDYHLDSYIKILGKVNDMALLRKKTDIEIVASRCEALGRVTIEAMKCSNPVIGTNSGGTPELIEEGITGTLFTYADANELSKRMKEFIENPEKIEKMGRAAYIYAHDRFTPQDNVNQILKIYREVISENKELIR